MSEDKMAENISLASRLRKNGMKLVLMKADKHIEAYLNYAKGQSYQKIYQINKSCTTITILDVETEVKTTVELSDFLAKED